MVAASAEEAVFVTAAEHEIKFQLKFDIEHSPLDVKPKTHEYVNDPCPSKHRHRAIKASKTTICLYIKFVNSVGIPDKMMNMRK